MEFQRHGGQLQSLTQIPCLSSCPHCPDIFGDPFTPTRAKGRDPHQPGVILGHHHLLSQAGWLPATRVPGTSSPLSRAAPAAALGRVALHWGEASVLRPAGRAVAGAGSPGGTPTGALHDSDARRKDKPHVLSAGLGVPQPCHHPLPPAWGPPGSGAASLLGCCTRTLGFVLPSPSHARARFYTHTCLSSRSLES